MESSPSTVLLVEDNEDNLRIYSTFLTYSGFRVIEATDGEAGLAAARAEIPAVILMDVSIPKLDGYEATRQLKADPATARIPIIALTAHALPSDRERAMNAGCDSYIAKPAEPRFVVEEVRRMLEKVAAA